VDPSENNDPFAGEHPLELMPELSVASKPKNARAPLVSPTRGLTFRFLEQIVTGGSLSKTITWNTGHALISPTLSVALHTTGVEPKGKIEPDAGTQPEERSPDASLDVKFQAATSDRD
jgi:hypothetical protein